MGEFERHMIRSAKRWAIAIIVASGLASLAILGGLGWAVYTLITWIVGH